MSKRTEEEIEQAEFEKVLDFAGLDRNDVGQINAYMEWLQGAHRMFTFHSCVVAGGEIRIPLADMEDTAKEGALVGIRIDEDTLELVIKNIGRVTE